MYKRVCKNKRTLESYIKEELESRKEKKIEEIIMIEDNLFESILEKYGYMFGKYRDFYSTSAIAHNTFNRILYYDDKECHVFEIAIILRIICLLGTLYEDSKRLLMYYSDFYVESNSYMATVIRGVLKWINNETGYCCEERMQMIQDYFNANSIKIRVYK